MSRLITASLFNQVDWFMSCPKDWKERAYQDLHNQLNRIYGESRDDQKRGFALEKAIQQYATSGTPTPNKGGSKYFQQLVQECQGGQFQKKTKRFIEVDGEEYCLYGKLDVWFPDIIKDIKSTGNYKGKSYYLKGFQHIMYCYITSIPAFKYLVAEFVDESPQIADVHIIDYVTDDINGLREPIIDRIKQVTTILKGQEELWQAYLKTFSLY